MICIKKIWNDVTLAVYKRVGEIGNSVHTMTSSVKLTYGEGVIIRKLEEVRRTFTEHSDASKRTQVKYDIIGCIADDML